MEIKNKINEKHFNLEIYEWDDFTLGLLKLYSDWKCNGAQVPVVSQPIMEKAIQNYSLPLFTKSELICRNDNISIYKPVIDFLFKHLSGEFTKLKLRDVLSNCYANNGRVITDNSARVYSIGYRRYMIDAGLIKQVGNNFILIEKKNQNLKVKS